jgi:hypothetical protein
MNSDMSLIPITTQTPSTDFDTSAKVDSLSTDKLKDKVKEARDPWLALANFVVAHSREITKDGQTLPGAAEAHKVAEASRIATPNLQALSDLANQA